MQISIENVISCVAVSLHMLLRASAGQVGRELLISYAGSGVSFLLLYFAGFQNHRLLLKKRDSVLALREIDWEGTRKKKSDRSVFSRDLYNRSR